MASNHKPTNLQLALIFLHILFISIGIYYNYDFPQLYEAEIISEFRINTEQLDYLYSVYSIPNFVLLIFATPLIGKTGLGMMCLLSTAVIFFSSILKYLSFYTKNYIYLIIARTVIGCGAELCVISVYTIAERWYKGRFLSFAQGSCRSISFASISVAFYFGPQFLIKTRSMYLSLFVCGIVSFVGFVASFGYYILENVLKSQARKKRKIDYESLGQNEEKSKSLKVEEEDEKEKSFNLRDVTKLRGLFWLLAFLFGLGCQGYYQFINFATDCLTNRYGYSFSEAKNKLSIIPLVSIILMPIFSGMIVKIGKKGFVLLVSFIIYLVNFLLMLSYPEKPGNYIYWVIALISVGYCLFVSTIWPCMTLAAPSKATSVALGFGLNAQNLFLTLMPLVFGKINENRDVKAYNNSLKLLVLIMIASILLNLVVIVVDFRSGKLLHLPENDERVAIIRQQMEDDE